MHDVLLIGAGGYGRVALGQMQEDVACGKEWRIAGFLDERKDILNGYRCDVPIVGDPFTYIPRPGDEFVCSLGSPAHRKLYTEKLRAANARFMNVMTELYIGPNVTFGSGVFVERRVQIGPDCRIGNLVHLHSLCILGHDIDVGDYAQIGCFAFVGGGAKIGALATIHPHATVLPGIKIGEGAVVGAGSVVIGNVPPGVTVYGNPAKRLTW